MSDELLERLGAEISPELLKLALTHSSFAYENGGSDNERLEFLGDSVLGYLVASHIYSVNPDLSEGELTKLKNGVVSAQALAVAANRIDLGKYLFLGKGEEQTEGRSKENILADAFEALIGAAYIHAGLDNASKVIEAHILPLLDDSDALREFADPKTSLAVKLKKLRREEPSYEMTESGPEHERVYFATCFSGKVSLGSGSGRTKRKAETDAALSALRTLSEL
ncbi:MAG: ribonuclease III [Aquiluna sp.]|jgi:ribonuclease-3